MNFLNQLHENRYNELLERSSRSQSRERQPIFYILAAFEDTYKAAEHVYDFGSDSIRNTCISRLELDYDSHVELIKLAFNLYNFANKCNICEVMLFCGSKERIVAVEAIKIRYGMEDIV